MFLNLKLYGLVFLFGVFILPLSVFASSYNFPEIDITGEVEADCKGNKQSISYDQAIELVTPSDDTWAKFAEHQFLDTEIAKRVFDQIKFRNFEGDRDSAEQLYEKLAHFTSDTAVFMESGGSHSIAMAVKLMEKGYCAVWKYTEALSENNAHHLAQDIAALKFHAPEFNKFKLANRNGLPVFIMDTHSTMTMAKSPFPTWQDFKTNKINKVLWITEGQTDEAPRKVSENRTRGLLDRPTSDSLPLYQVFADYQKNGIELFQLRINPYPFRSELPTVTEPDEDGFLLTECQDQAINVYEDAHISYRNKNYRYFMNCQGEIFMIEAVKVEGVEMAMPVFNQKLKEDFEKLLLTEAKTNSKVREFLHKTNKN